MTWHLPITFGLVYGALRVWGIEARVAMKQTLHETSSADGERGVIAGQIEDRGAGRDVSAERNISIESQSPNLPNLQTAPFLSPYLTSQSSPRPSSSSSRTEETNLQPPQISIPHPVTAYLALTSEMRRRPQYARLQGPMASRLALTSPHPCPLLGTRG